MSNCSTAIDSASAQRCSSTSQVRMEVVRVQSSARARALSLVELPEVRTISLRTNTSTAHQTLEQQLLPSTRVDDVAPLRAVVLKQRGTAHPVTHSAHGLQSHSSYDRTAPPIECWWQLLLEEESRQSHLSLHSTIECRLYSIECLVESARDRQVGRWTRTAAPALKTT